MNHSYHPSGKYSPYSFLLFLLAAIFFLPLLGVVYAYALWNSHLGTAGFFVYLIFLLALPYFIALFVIQWGKVRNESLAKVFGLVGGLVFLCFHWAAWVTLFDNVSEVGFFHLKFSHHYLNFHDIFNTVTHPMYFFERLVEINAQGTWHWITRSSRFDAGAIRGPLLTGVWLIEALALLAFSKNVPALIARQPFSESTQSWHKLKYIPVQKMQNISSFLSKLKKGDETVLHSLRRVGDESKSHTLLELYYSEEGEFYLNIEDFIYKVYKKPKRSFIESGNRSNLFYDFIQSKTPLRGRTVLEYLHISESAGKKLMSL